ncbi:hypothetical protein D9M72_454760 [compost metagenome]
MLTALPASANGIPFALVPAALTSVTYTRPASASPDVTLPRTSVTDDSSLTGAIVTPAAFSTASAAAPHGTWPAQTTTLTPGLARSAKEAIDAGLDGGTAICRTLVAKFVAAPSRSPASASLAMFVVSAEANTSAGAPWLICVARSEEPAKLSVTLVPGFFFSNSSASVVKVALSEAAAKTVMVPESCPAVSEDAPAAGPADVDADGAQAARPAMSAAAVSSAATRGFLVFTRCSFPAAFQ